MLRLIALNSTRCLVLEGPVISRHRHQCEPSNRTLLQPVYQLCMHGPHRIEKYDDMSIASVTSQYVTLTIFSLYPISSISTNRMTHSAYLPSSISLALKCFLQIEVTIRIGTSESHAASLVYPEQYDVEDDV